MDMDLRPDWCPDRTCVYLNSYDGRMCSGRMAHTGNDGGILNTHHFCNEESTLEINDEDAWAFGKCLSSVRKDVANNSLYRPPGYKVIWDFAKEYE